MHFHLMFIASNAYYSRNNFGCYDIKLATNNIFLLYTLSYLVYSWLCELLYQMSAWMVVMINDFGICHMLNVCVLFFVNSAQL